MKVTTNNRVYEHIDSIAYSDNGVIAKGRTTSGASTTIIICGDEHITSIENDSRLEFLPDLSFGANVATCVSCYCEGGIYKNVKEFYDDLREFGATEDIIQHIQYVVVEQKDDDGNPLFPIKR